jgi:hypothetical protein
VSAAGSLAARLWTSRARRVAFLGLAKNVGKTTALVSVLAELHRMGVAAGTTSAGRDGEAFDAITGEPKPRFRVWPGQFVASAESTFAAASFPTTEVATLSFPTRFGPVQLRRSEGEGEIELIGPSTAAQMDRSAAALEAAGAEILLLDGAIGRRAFAGARVADAVVLCVGMAAGATVEAVLAATRGALELLRLKAPREDASITSREGAVTDVSLREQPPSPGQTLVAEDFTSIFLTLEERRALRDRGVLLAVRKPARLLAVTANPTAPARPPVPAARFFEALVAEASGTPVYDLEADLESV